MVRKHRPESSRILYLTSEIHPQMKTGGLGEVSGALPPALRALGADVRVLLPGYPRILAALEDARFAHRFATLGAYPASILLEAKLAGGVPGYVIDCPPLYWRDGGPYTDLDGNDWPDNAMRFGLLSQIGALLASDASPLAWRPQIAQCNDWQTGLLPAYLHYQGGTRAATVMGIHNVAYQGIFPPSVLTELGLPPESFSINGVEYYGNMSFLKAGIYYADHITTVSPTYAKEIQSAPLGFGLQGLLATRSGALTGILNGIGTDAWDPAYDRLIPANYSSRDLAGKAVNKRALQNAMGLTADPEIPLLGMVSRIAYQKGVDVVLEAAERLLVLPSQLVMLGSGEHALEVALSAFAAAHPGRAAAHIGFDEPLAHLIEAGADIFLMPSRYEPCGLNQLYSQLYGTPPVGHATGGLNDTITDCTPEALAAGHATGFLFHDMSADGLVASVSRAVDLYREKAAWQGIQQAGMARDFSWRASAQGYLEVYRRLVG
jgi:starch synthase